VPVQVTIGPDLARPLHNVWPTVELHAQRLDRLCRQLARTRFELHRDDASATLHLVVPIGAEESIRVVLDGEDVRYCLVQKDQWMQSDQEEPLVDRGVYLMLAALAERPPEE
jgi:hypothetical protein